MNKNEKQAIVNKFFEKAHIGGKPAVVMFRSKKCPPCDAFKPVFDKFSMNFNENVNFFSFDISEEPVVVEKLKIRSMPTLLFLRNNEEACSRLSGYIESMDVKEKIENVLGGTCPKMGRQKVTADVVVLGAGPAGLSAAMYAARSKLYTVVIDRALPGGQVSTTFKVENYAGTPGPIEGPVLMDNMVKQAESFGAEIVELREVMNVDLVNKIRHVATEDTDYYAKVVIIATGAQPRHLPVEKEEDFRGRGLHYCATCDGALYQDTDIIVVGGGNSAVEEAVNLTTFASKVTVISKSDSFSATKASQDELNENPKIDVIWNSRIVELKGDMFLEKVVLKNKKTGNLTEMPIEGIFTFIGMIPRTDLFKDIIEMDNYGYILTDENMETSIPGVYACGDVRQKSVRQIANAVGDGAIAAIFTEKYISSLKD